MNRISFFSATTVRSETPGVVHSGITVSLSCRCQAPGKQRTLDRSNALNHNPCCNLEAHEAMEPGAPRPIHSLRPQPVLRSCSTNKICPHRPSRTTTLSLYHSDASMVVEVRQDVSEQELRMVSESRTTRDRCLPIPNQSSEPADLKYGSRYTSSSKVVQSGGSSPRLLTHTVFTGA